MSEPELRKHSGGKYGEFCRLLGESFGYEFESGRGVVGPAVQGRLEELGLADEEQYQAVLADAGGGAELFALAGELVCGATEFIDAHLVAICERFLRPILRSRLTNRAEGSKPSLAIWSVGCGNGAEVYSVLGQLGKLINPAVWELRILGTEANSELIKLARRGVYGQSELKGAEGVEFGKHFVRSSGGSGQESRWAVAGGLRNIAEFRLHNILAPEVPGDFTNRFNLILCRGLLGHLSEQARCAVVSKLSRSLSPGGLLVVGRGEAAGLDHALLERLGDQWQSVLRRRVGRSKRITAKPRQVRRQRGRSGLRKKLLGMFLSACSEPAAKRRKPPVKVVDEGAAAAEFVERAKGLADDFQFPQALLACRRARQLDEFNVEGHYLCGVVARRMDRLDEAVEALERACYLDKTLVMGHFLLGHIYQERGREALARRHYAVAAEALEGKTVDEPVRFAEGMSVELLRGLCSAGQEAVSGVGQEEQDGCDEEIYGLCRSE